MKKWFILLPLILLGLLALTVLLAIGAFRIVNPTNGRLVSAGEERRYLLYVPDSYDPSVPTPLVITLHGFVQWPANQAAVSRWNKLADEYGFIVVYPAGTGFPMRWRTWGAADPTQDITFISDLIDKLSAEYNIDPARVYANGLSNGGGMTFVLSCKLSERIAAIGTVAGAYSLPWDECNPSRPVPAIIFHGTADPIVPYQGGSAGPSAPPSVHPRLGRYVCTAQRLRCNPASPAGQRRCERRPVHQLRRRCAFSTPSPGAGIPGPAAATSRKSSSARPRTISTPAAPCGTSSSSTR